MVNPVYKRCKTLLHLQLLKTQRYWRESRRWRQKFQDLDSIRVFYGHDSLPGRGEKAGGGIIKCQDLADRFPNTIRGANILYLVSSALPHFAPLMVRIAKQHGVRLILNQNGVAYPAWHGPGWDATNADMKAILALADYVVYQSEFCKISADRYLGTCKGPSTVLHNPVDTSFFVPAKEIPVGRCILLAGSHEHFYRVRCAIEMMGFLKDRMPDVRLRVAGRYLWRPDPAQALREAEELARALGVAQNVLFTSSYTQEEVVPLMQSAHLLVHPKYNDPCPRLVVEAMACGLPVVYSASGGVPELVGNHAGIGIRALRDWERDHPPDPNLLSQAVSEIFDNYMVFRNEARARSVSNFGTQKWLAEHERIFRSVIEIR